MIEDILSVREFEISDIDHLLSYWLNAEKSHLENMGVDIHKIPTREEFIKYLTTQFETPIEQKQSYCIIWQKNNIPIGHSNTRPTLFGKEAFMHLHIWNNETRRKGIGYELVKLTLPYFFENLKLKELYCEPYSLNPAPHKTIQKAGFELIKEHVTTPGAFNFEQPVKRWHMSFEKYRQLYKTE
jgi:RimJ/RimL family protein N-acetyltransferase